MADTSIHRPVVESYEYATDFDPDDTASGTWTTIPRTQILNDGLEHPAEEAQTVQGMNLQDLMAMLLMRAILPLALKANDTFQSGLIAATTNLTPVWFRVKELGKDTRKIVGGQFGCIVVYERKVVPQPGQLASAMVRLTAPPDRDWETYRG